MSKDWNIIIPGETLSEGLTYRYNFRLEGGYNMEDIIINWLSNIAKRWYFIVSPSHNNNNNNNIYAGYCSLKTKKRLETMQNTLPDILKATIVSQIPEGRRPKNPSLKENEVSYDSKKGRKDFNTNPPIKLMVSISLWESTLISLVKNPRYNGITLIAYEHEKIDMRPICTTLGLQKLIIQIPLCNSVDKLFNSVHNADKLGCYFIELDITISNDKLVKMCNAIECIKYGQYWRQNGDHLSCSYIDPPLVFVFIPLYSDLVKIFKAPLWKFWSINSNNELVRLQ